MRPSCNVPAVLTISSLMTVCQLQRRKCDAIVNPRGRRMPCPALASIGAVWTATCGVLALRRRSGDQACEFGASAPGSRTAPASPLRAPAGRHDDARAAVEQVTELADAASRRIQDGHLGLHPDRRQGRLGAGHSPAPTRPPTSPPADSVRRSRLRRPH